MKILRKIPAIHQLQKHPNFIDFMNNADIAEHVLTEWLDEQIDSIRKQILTNELNGDQLTREKLVDLIFNKLDQKVHACKQSNLRNVINATGVVLHTNLGRARLSKQAIEQITNTASAYSTLEFNLETGKRGSRHDIVEEYVKQLTGAEAAMVVNNNASAVFLVLRAMATGQEVIVSRGELVEIGGSFRISEIMEESEAHLVGVGTSNKTYVQDYEQAITEDTALLMKVHKSNFKVVGFTNDVDSNELIKLAQEYHIPIYEDLGSGTLFDFKEQQIRREPTVQEKVSTGIDLISFSGDKLLGGPQAGIIVGKKIFIDQLKQHQLARVLRVDKFTLAGLEATLKSYIRGQEVQEIPTVRDILEPKESILEKAKMFIEKIRSSETRLTCQVISGHSKVGGGTMPDEEIDTYVVQVKHDHYTSTELAERLRRHSPPIIVRIKDETVMLDFRTVDREELVVVIEAFLQIEHEVV